MKRDDLPDVVEKALRAIGGTASVARVAEEIWNSEKRNSGRPAIFSILGNTKCDGRSEAPRCR